MVMRPLRRNKKRCYQLNKGRECSTPGCNYMARVKGLCNSCYNKEYNKYMKREKDELVLMGTGDIKIDY